MSMDQWLAFAQGPFFRFTFAVMVLGLLRNVILTVWSMFRAHRLTQHKRLSWLTGARETVDWLVPVRHLRQRWFYSVSSIVFHVGGIVTPVFLFGHISLLNAAVGLSWPALPEYLADTFTLVTLAALVILLLGRLGGPASRPLSRSQDYLIPVLLGVPFLSGFLASNPQFNPFPYNPTLLVHTLSAGVCFFVVPFTKLTHMALQPLARLCTQLAWRFPPDYPELVADQIHGKDRPI
jgi:nitrate reductase gamma subunit